MKQFVSFLALVILFASCSEAKKEGNTIVKGSIKGLKKGTVYLQKIQDTALVAVDSVHLDGKSDFVLATTIEEPEVLYLYLKKKDGAEFNDFFDFFAEPGETQITTTLKDFEKDANVTGSKNQEKLQEYKKIRRRFNDSHLRIIKSNFEAKKQNDTAVLIKNNTDYQNLVKRKYLYTVNFAISNADLEVAPYVTMNEIFDANIKYLDTIAMSLSPKIQESLYGKQLTTYIKDRKRTIDSIQKLRKDSIQ